MLLAEFGRLFEVVVLVVFRGREVVGRHASLWLSGRGGGELRRELGRGGGRDHGGGGGSGPSFLDEFGHWALLEFSWVIEVEGRGALEIRH